MSSKKIVLTSSDGESFEVEEVVVRRSQMIADMIEGGYAEKAIPLQNVTGKILGLVIEYCKTHVHDDVAPEGDNAAEEAKKKKKKMLEDWDAEFMKNLDFDNTVDLLLAANFLSVSGLCDLLCEATSDHIKDKTVEEMREMFGIENDLTAEEEVEIREDSDVL